MWAATCRVGPACPWHLTSSAPLSPKAAATPWHREVTCLSRGHMLRKRPVAQGHADQQATLSSPTQRSLWPGRGIKRYLSLRLVGTLLGGRESPGTPGKAWRRENSGRTAAASSGRDSGPQNAPGLARRGSGAVGGAGKTGLGRSVPSGGTRGARLVAPTQVLSLPYVYLNLLVFVSIANGIFIQVPALGTCG